MAAPKVEPKIYTAIVLDFETGGLDCRDCACTQIAMQAVRLDSWEVLGSYQKYITPYHKQDIGGTPKRKVLKTRHTIEEEAGALMKYEKEALAYTAITIETLNLMGFNIKEVAGEVIEFVQNTRYRKVLSANRYLSGRISLST